MSQEEQTKTGMLGSTYWRLLLVIVAGLFTFGGPYATYMLNHILGLDFAFSVVFGLALFVLGLLLIWYLIRLKIVS